MAGLGRRLEADGALPGNVGVHANLWVDAAPGRAVGGPIRTTGAPVEIEAQEGVIRRCSDAAPEPQSIARVQKRMGFGDSSTSSRSRHSSFASSVSERWYPRVAQNASRGR